MKCKQHHFILYLVILVTIGCINNQLKHYPPKCLCCDLSVKLSQLFPYTKSMMFTLTKIIMEPYYLLCSEDYPYQSNQPI